ncbi:hypothetical protein VTH06DRAFT_7893 [Thermothelomyces fergusii]
MGRAPTTVTQARGPGLEQRIAAEQTGVQQDDPTSTGAGPPISASQRVTQPRIFSLLPTRPFVALTGIKPGSPVASPLTISKE